MELSRLDSVTKNVTRQATRPVHVRERLVQSEEEKKATVCLLSHFVFFSHLIVDEIEDDQHCNDEACE